jgi:hypothetical protein
MFERSTTAHCSGLQLRSVGRFIERVRLAMPVRRGLCPASLKTDTIVDETEYKNIRH